MENFNFVENLPANYFVIQKSIHSFAKTFISKHRHFYKKTDKFTI